MNKIPSIYKCPFPGKAKLPYLTFYQIIAGPPEGITSPPFRTGTKLRIVPFWSGYHRDVEVRLFCGKTDYASPSHSFPDGTSNTILIAEAVEGIPWSKPGDLFYDDAKGGPFPRLAGPVGMGDSAVTNIQKVSQQTLRSLILANDGVPPGNDFNPGEGVPPGQQFKMWGPAQSPY